MKISCQKSVSATIEYLVLVERLTGVTFVYLGKFKSSHLFENTIDGQKILFCPVRCDKSYGALILGKNSKGNYLP
jgi:hypothetical protein